MQAVKRETHYCFVGIYVHFSGSVNLKLSPTINLSHWFITNFQLVKLH